MPDVARLLGVSRPRVWQLRKKPDFPEPAGSEGGRDYWYEAAILRWAANAGRDLASRAPVLFRPAVSERPTEYIGAELIEGHVILAWSTAYGVVGLGYRQAYWDRPPPRTLLDLWPELDTAVSARPQWDLWGPEISAVDRESPKRLYVPRWTDLERVLGTPAPWWPAPLRKPDEMVRWTPGSRPRQTDAVPAVDVSPLLRLGVDAPDESPVNVVLIHMARRIQELATERASREVVDLDGAPDRDAIALAAVPTETRPAGDEPTIDVRRAAWLEILDRTDTLAEDCVSCILQWDGGRDFPFASFEELYPTDELVPEWADRLRPAERTAAFVALGGERVVETFVDPVTELPVGRDVKGIYLAAVPQFLPTRSELAEVVLAEDHRVWIRTADGHLYLAPQRRGFGLAYGYRGAGPQMLARLIDQLLDDVGSLAPETWAEPPAPDGLLAGTTGAWKAGDVLSRDVLIAAQGNE